MDNIENQCKYIITDRFGVIEVAPLGEGDFVIAYERDDDGKYFYTKLFQGKITFTGAVFNRLHKIERSIYLCTLQRMQVIRLYGGAIVTEKRSVIMYLYWFSILFILILFCFGYSCSYTAVIIFAILPRFRLVSLTVG